MARSPSLPSEVAAHPAEGPDWEHGLGDSFQRFDEGLQSWRRREQAACRERNKIAAFDLKAVIAGDQKSRECLKTSFKDRSADGGLQVLHSIGREQRMELHQILELVRSHANHFDNPESLLEQMPSPGGSARRMTGSDVVALLAELLDIASRSLDRVHPPHKTKRDATEPEGRDGRERGDRRRAEDEENGYSRRGGRDDRMNGRESKRDRHDDSRGPPRRGSGGVRRGDRHEDRRDDRRDDSREAVVRRRGEVKADRRDDSRDLGQQRRRTGRRRGGVGGGVADVGARRGEDLRRGGGASRERVRRGDDHDEDRACDRRGDRERGRGSPRPGGVARSRTPRRDEGRRQEEDRGGRSPRGRGQRGSSHGRAHETSRGSNGVSGGGSGRRADSRSRRSGGGGGGTTDGVRLTEK